MVEGNDAAQSADEMEATGAADWSWHAPLAGDLDLEDGTGAGLALQPIHAHRFRRQAGSVGWLAEHRDATLRLEYRLWTTAEAGTISLWISPLEDLGPVAAGHSISGDLPRLMPLVSDVYPGQRLKESNLALIATTRPNPGLQGKVMQGISSTFLQRQAYIHFEHLPLRRGWWYQLGIGWDTRRQRIELYLNGELVNASEGLNFDAVLDAFYFGNPMMVFADLRMADRLLAPELVRETYRKDLAESGRSVDPFVRELLHGTAPTKLELDLDGYERQTATAFTRQDEVDRWVQQGPDHTSLKERRATPEGLLLETRETLESLNRCYLWGPERYEGDLVLRYEFRSELDTGLALVVFNATTFHRQDVIAQRDYPITGSMETIRLKIRNYWWEYMRRVPPLRKDVGTHVLSKGPYGHKLGFNVSDLPKVDTWHQLTVHKEGDRIKCAIDGYCLLDAVDSPFAGHGSSYNSGRIALRHMQQTRVRYRNLEVYTRPDWE